MLKPQYDSGEAGRVGQPPSGGCVLKHGFDGLYLEGWDPAAFGRLCVETFKAFWASLFSISQPPSGGCVLKLWSNFFRKNFFHPAAFGRLCVETFGN